MGQVEQDRTGRTGQDRQNRTVQAEQDRTGRTGQDRQYRTGRIGQAEQDIMNENCKFLATKSHFCLFARLASITKYHYFFARFVRIARSNSCYA
jgi:hypothetical protein